MTSTAMPRHDGVVLLVEIVIENVGARHLAGSASQPAPSNDWPNIVIGVQPASAETIGTLETSSGWNGPATEGGCPGEFDFSRHLYSSSLRTTPVDTSETAIVVVDGTTLAPHTIELGERDDCGRDIACAKLDADSGTWSDAVYLNPCAGW